MINEWCITCNLRSQSEKCFRSLWSHYLFSSSFIMSVVIIISCLFRWSFCATCSWAVYCEDLCILENALFLIINSSSSVSLSRNRRRRRLLELCWDVWTVAAHQSQVNIWIFWRSVRECLKISINSFHAYLLTFSLEDRWILNTSTMYNASFVFWLRTSISRIRSFLFYEYNFSIRFFWFKSEWWLRFRVASFSWTF
jgi:hypothetical protein